MKNKITLLILLTLLFKVNLSAQWVQQLTVPKGGLMISMDFTNFNHGAIGGWLLYKGFGQVTGAGFHTFDGGVIWNRSTMPDTVRSINAIKFISELTGFAIGSYNPSILKERKENISGENIFTPYSDQGIDINNGVKEFKGLVLKTTDGGATWFTFGNVPDSINNLTSFQIVDSQNVFVSVSIVIQNVLRAGIAKTDLNFQNWKFLPVPFNDGYISKLKYIESSVFGVGYMMTGQNFSGVILQSNNKGKTWKSEVFPVIKEFSDVRFINNNTGFVSGKHNSSTHIYNSCIYKTTDNGNTWLKLNLNLDSITVLGMEVFPNNNFLILYGNKLAGDPFPFSIESFIARSNDLGNSWNFKIIDDPQTMIMNCQFLSSIDAYCIGGVPRYRPLELFFDPVVLKTTNGGSVFFNSGNSHVIENYLLFQNYPNPFNPKTVIRYNIIPLYPRFEKGGNGVFVQLKVYDTLGNEIVTLVNERKSPGSYQLQFDGSNLSSGIYFYKLEAGNYSEVKKMILLK